MASFRTREGLRVSLSLFMLRLLLSTNAIEHNTLPNFILRELFWFSYFWLICFVGVGEVMRILLIMYACSRRVKSNG